MPRSTRCPRFAEWSAGGAQVLYLGEEDGERRFTVTEPGTPLAEASRNVEREGVLITFDDRGLLTFFRTSWSAKMYDEFALDWSASIEPATVPEGDISPMPGT